MEIRDTHTYFIAGVIVTALVAVMLGSAREREEIAMIEVAVSPSPQAIEDLYRSSSYLVIATLSAPVRSSAHEAPTDNVRLVVVAEKLPGRDGELECGSLLYGQPACHLFLEPINAFGLKYQKYLGVFSGRFVAGEVTFVPPNTIELISSDGDAGHGYLNVWNINIASGSLMLVKEEILRP